MTITLFRANGSWVAQSDSYKALFGCDTLPTAFTDKASPDMVHARISVLNPDHTVIVR